MCGLPEVHERVKRSDRGERSRTRNGIARNMLRGESWTCFVGASQPTWRELDRTMVRFITVRV